MLINNCVRNEEDGSLDFDFSVTEAEASFLMDHAIKNLVFNGVLKIQEEDSQQELDLFRQEGGVPS
jgi:hypothetical protein